MTRTLILALLCGALAAVESAPVPVVRVIDGDTLHVLVDVGGISTSLPVRLLWIDAPEPGEAGADAATAALRDLVDGRRVTLWTPGDRFALDRWGRILAAGYVEHDGQRTLVQQVLVVQGHARYLADTYPAPARQAALLTR
jgi:endonuclease YncB( thermonuclease family)